MAVDLAEANRVGLALLKARLDGDDERFRLLLVTSPVTAAALLTVYLDLLVHVISLGAIDRASLDDALLVLAGSPNGG